MDIPSLQSWRADCGSGTPIFWSPSFLVERGCDGLQVGRVGPVISLYSPSRADRRPKWDCVFSNITPFENGERLMIKVEQQKQMAAENAVSKLNVFFLAWGDCFFFIYLWENFQGCFVLYARCNGDICYHFICIFSALSVGRFFLISWDFLFLIFVFTF